MAKAKAKILSAKDILNVEDRSFIEVEVPEWGGVVRLASLNAAEAIEFMEMNKNEESKKWATVEIVSRSAVDETGARLFTREDVEALKRKSIKIFIKLSNEALILNGLTKDQQDAAKNASSETASAVSPIS